MKITPSILKIKENNKCSTEFHFKDVDENFISNQIDRLGSKKATGCDGISAKLLKLAKPSIVTPVTIMINNSFHPSEFPDPLKVAEVAPIHKKNSTLEKGNYRPVSILPVISKIYERSINAQLSDFFGYISIHICQLLDPGMVPKAHCLKLLRIGKRHWMKINMSVLSLWIFQRHLIVSHTICYCLN